jgi:hypothetical protein
VAVDDRRLVTIRIAESETAAGALAADRQRRLRREELEYRDVIGGEQPPDIDLTVAVQPEHGTRGGVARGDAAVGAEEDAAGPGRVIHVDRPVLTTPADVERPAGAVHENGSVAIAVLNIDGAVENLAHLLPSPHVIG